MVAEGLEAPAEGLVDAVADDVEEAVGAAGFADRTREVQAEQDWQNRISRAAQLVTTKYGIPGLKYAMDLNGYYGGVPRLPLTPPSAAAKAEIEAAFHEIKG